MKINPIGHLVKVGKTNPNKPKVKIGKMNVTSANTMNYELRTMNYFMQNKPKQSQNVAEFHTGELLGIFKLGTNLDNICLLFLLIQVLYGLKPLCQRKTGHIVSS